MLKSLTRIPPASRRAQGIPRLTTTRSLGTATSFDSKPSKSGSPRTSPSSSLIHSPQLTKYTPFPRALSLPSTHRSLATLASDRPGPTLAYDEQVASGIIQDDAHQRSIVAILQAMYDRVEAYDAAPIPLHQLHAAPPSFFSKLFQSSKPATPSIPENVPKGLYLFGSVGCGKSFLMDLFYENLPAKFENSKRRVHFHAFMMDVHQRGHRLKGQLGDDSDWILHVASELAREARILCFDEFQVTDIADAMILRRLMEAMMGYGVVAVMTSNRTPDDLYKNGIQREQFIPCIDLIKDRFLVQCLDSDIDYRKMPRALSKVYFSPVTPENTSEFGKLFDGLTHDEPVVPHRQLSVWGRTVDVPLSTTKVAKFSFVDLCGKALSAADYIEITKSFETIFLTDVPLLTLNEKDKARRFILFIDAAYEARTKIFVLSDPPIHAVFSDKKTSGSDEISAHQRSIMDDLGLSADSVGASSMFTGEEEVFAFARAVSRLTEMGSLHWSQGGTKPVKVGPSPVEPTPTPVFV